MYCIYYHSSSNITLLILIWQEEGRSIPPMQPLLHGYQPGNRGRSSSPISADRTVRKTDNTTAATTTNLHPLSPPALKLASKYKNSPSSEAFDIATGFRLYTKIISQTTNTTTTTSNTNSTTTKYPTLDDGEGKIVGK